MVACFADEPAQDDLMTDNLMTNDLRKIKTLDLSVGQPAMSCVISPACHLKQVFAEATKAFCRFWTAIRWRTSSATPMS